MEAFHHLPVQCPLVQHTVLLEAILQTVVHFGHGLPHLKEALLQVGQVAGLEVEEELLQGLDLPLVQEVHPVHGGKVGPVRKELVGLHQVLVDVVEVVYQYFAPAIEVVERLWGVYEGGIDVVEAADAEDVVAGREVGELLKKVVDGDEARSPYGALCDVGQEGVHVQLGALAREYNGHLG